MGCRLSEVSPAYSRLAGLERGRVWGECCRYVVMTALETPAALSMLVSPNYPVRKTRFALM